MEIPPEITVLDNLVQVLASYEAKARQMSSVQIVVEVALCCFLAVNLISVNAPLAIVALLLIYFTGGNTRCLLAETRALEQRMVRESDVSISSIAHVSFGREQIGLVKLRSGYEFVLKFGNRRVASNIIGGLEALARERGLPVQRVHFPNGLWVKTRASIFHGQYFLNAYAWATADSSATAEGLFQRYPEGKSQLKCELAAALRRIVQTQAKKLSPRDLAELWRPLLGKGYKLLGYYYGVLIVLALPKKAEGADYRAS